MRHPKFSVILFYCHLCWLSSSSFATKASRHRSFTWAFGVCAVENSSSDKAGNEKSPNTETKMCYQKQRQLVRVKSRITLRCERANTMWIEICMTWLSAENILGDWVFGFAALFNIVKLHSDGHGDSVRNLSKWMDQLKADRKLESVIESLFQYWKLWPWRTVWNFDRAGWFPSTPKL